MARTSIPITNLAFQSGASITYTAADATNDMMYKNDGDTVLVIKNGGGSSVSVTVKSVADEAGRLGDINLSVAAGSEAVVSMLRPSWWNQKTDLGNVYVDFDVDTDVSVAAVKIRK
jgi:hypothetical protein